MKKIFYKSIRDLKKLFTPFIVSVVFATSFISLIAKYLQGEKFPMSDFLYLLFSLSIILFFGFCVLFLMNLFITKFIDNNIFIYPIESVRKPKQKLLLQITNDNDDDMNNVRVEFKNLFVGEIGNLESVIKADNNFFSKGLVERGNVISANTSIKVEIAENVEGTLKLLLDDEFCWDVLAGMQEFKKRHVCRLGIKISAKLGDTFFDKTIEFPFIHWIDEQITEISGDDENPVRKHPSGLEWMSSQS